MFDNFLIKIQQPLTQMQDGISFSRDERVHLFAGDLGYLFKGEIVQLIHDEYFPLLFW